MMNYFSVQLLLLACVSHAHGHSPHPPKHMRCTETVCKYAQVIAWVNEFHFLINSLYKSVREEYQVCMCGTAVLT